MLEAFIMFTIVQVLPIYSIAEILCTSKYVTNKTSHYHYESPRPHDHSRQAPAMERAGQQFMVQGVQINSLWSGGWRWGLQLRIWGVQVRSSCSEGGGSIVLSPGVRVRCSWSLGWEGKVSSHCSRDELTPSHFPPLNRRTDTTENIIFPRTTYVIGNYGTLADPRGNIKDMHSSPLCPISFIFMQFSEKL